MLRQAYGRGILLALQNEGFVKEAGATHGIKTLAESAWGGIKNYFTGKGVRQALADYGEVARGGPASDKLNAIMKDIIARLEHSTPPSVKSMALREVKKSLVPYAAPAAIGAGAAALPSAVGSLYPNV